MIGAVKILEVLAFKKIFGHLLEQAITFSRHNPKETKISSRLRLRLNHLGEHKFKDSFQDFLNPTALG